MYVHGCVDKVYICHVSFGFFVSFWYICHVKFGFYLN